MRSASSVAASTIFICRIYTTSHFALVALLLLLLLPLLLVSFATHTRRSEAQFCGNAMNTLSWHKHLRVGVLFLAHAPVQAVQLTHLYLTNAICEARIFCAATITCTFLSGRQVKLLVRVL